ncbi:hypothetical protein N9C31_00925 [Gammaproteobacteria bacterium]|nr:hypothetical protein [Gammaproteobacteria bacterium]
MPQTTKKPNITGLNTVSSSNPVWDFFSFIFWLVTSPITLPFKVISQLFNAILSALSKITIIKNCRYILTGHCDSDQKHTHPSVKGAQQSSREIYWAIAKIIVTGLMYSALMYTNVFMYRTFLDAFGSSNSLLFNETLIQYTVLTILLVAVRAISKYMRKSTQSHMTFAIREQWSDLITSVNLNAIAKKIIQAPGPAKGKDQKTSLSQLIQEEVDDTASYAIVTITQLLYMICDAAFYSYFLMSMAPNLMILALITTAICTLAISIPGRKLLELEKEYRTCETKLRDAIGVYNQNDLTYYRIGISAKKDINESTRNAFDVYQKKLFWETIYSGINRLISFLSIPAALVLIAPGFSTGAMTFGVVMASLRCYKDFFNSIMHLNNNQKMFNKFETGVTRLQVTAKVLYEQKIHEKLAGSKYEVTGQAITIPKDTAFSHNDGNENTTYTISTGPKLSFGPGIHFIKGPSGSGKSILFSIIEGSFLQDPSATMTESKKIQIPFEFGSDSFFHHHQSSRDIKLIGNPLFSARELIQKTFPQLNDDEINIPQGSGFSIKNEDLQKPFVDLSGGQKDSITLIGLFAVLDKYKKEPEQLPLKTIILDEVDQGLGQEGSSGHSQVTAVFNMLAKKLAPYKKLITLITSHNIAGMPPSEEFKLPFVSEVEVAVTKGHNNASTLTQKIFS